MSIGLKASTDNTSGSIQINGSDRVTVDSSGNVGIGTSSPAGKLHTQLATSFSWGGAWGAGAAVFGGATSSAGAFGVSYNDTDGAVLGAIASGVAWKNISLYSSNLILCTNGASERMRIDSAGNVGIGTSSPNAKLDVNGNIAASTAVETRGAFAYFQSYNTGAGTNLKYWRWYGNTSGALVFETVNDAYTSATERMRVASGGEVLINATAATSFFDGKLNVAGRTHLKDTLTPLYAWNPSTTGDNTFVVFLTETAGTARGSIYYSRVSGQVVYAATSDYRAKDILGPVANTGAIIDALKVHTGQMHGGSIAYPMLVAHEAQEVIPFAVSGEKDAVNEDGSPKYQQMDHAILVPMLIAEIQSLRARVAALEAA